MKPNYIRNNHLAIILFQCLTHDEILHPTHFVRPKTWPGELNYSNCELEVLTIVEALKKFCVYLLGLHFKIIINCIVFKQCRKGKCLR